MYIYRYICACINKDILCVYIYDSVSPPFSTAWSLFFACGFYRSILEDGAVILEKDIEASEVIDDFSRAILLGTTQVPKKRHFLYRGVSCYWLGTGIPRPFGRGIFLGPFFDLGGKRFVLRLNQLDVPQETGAQVLLKVTFPQICWKDLVLTHKNKAKGRCNLQFLFVFKAGKWKWIQSVLRKSSPTIGLMSCFVCPGGQAGPPRDVSNFIGF